MKLCRALIVMAAMGSFLVPIGRAQEQTIQDEQIKAYIAMMREDIREERLTIVDQAMDLQPAGKAKFWGVYDKYAGEMKVFWDGRLANIMKYADNHENMTDAIADELAIKALDLESQRQAIRKKYYGQMKNALGARIAVRFLQVEAILDHILDIQIGSEIPLME
jgi:hypothetical protein